MGEAASHLWRGAAPLPRTMQLWCRPPARPSPTFCILRSTLSLDFSH